ncbi:uncharacterized protein LOC131650703 [Vicia villosa]|uniref:uncharacterized protein LOC131650703 n=1 Tax=Vicia villosa TaxID=3911 RepID=UPI00273B384F|nr:uncharacterized protein LOC131650703 [Vicia villosa]
MAWEKVCTPKKNGGLRIINLQIWNKICLSRLLWNICRKADTLWVRWVHMYYIKNADVLQKDIKGSGSWITKQVLKIRNDNRLVYMGNGFRTGALYKEQMTHLPKVDWRVFVCKNRARPRAVFILWLACQNKLATKYRMGKFGVATDMKCMFCSYNEDVQHLFFECSYTKKIWEVVLGWLNISHTVQGWCQERKWLEIFCRSKNWRSKFVQVAIAETIYNVWIERNKMVFSRNYSEGLVMDSIIENTVNRIWVSPKYRERVASLLVN